MSQMVQLIRVFVSSPDDVPEERKAAMELLREISSDPLFEGKIAIDIIAWDKGGAVLPIPAHMTAQEAIDKGLRLPCHCDVVIVIFWARMGTPLAPEYKKADGSCFNSGTEWEFENAMTGLQQNGRPQVLVYRKMENIPFTPRDPQVREKANQLLLVESFFDARNGSYNEYSNADAFKGVLERHLRKTLLEMIRDKEPVVLAPPGANSTQPACHRLPPRTYGELLGREIDIERVLSELRSENPVITIEGFSGVGKTSLAIEVGHLCLAGNETRPDTVTFKHVVWISAKPKPKQRHWLDDVLNEIARVTEYSAITQMAKAQEKINKIDELLAAHRVLLIIDNFETIRDKALIQWIEKMCERTPGTSKVLITTRHHLLPMSQPVDLAGLATTEALKLIRKHAYAKGLHAIATRSDEELTPLIENTGGNPQAMVMSLGGIRGGTLSLQQVIDGLQANYRNRDIDQVFRYLFSKSWALLNENARRVLLMVPLFVGASSIRQDALREASGLSRDRFDGALAKLVEFNLLQVDFNSSYQMDFGLPRYVAHPLTLTFARLKLERKPAFEKEARERWGKYFLHFVKKNIVRTAPLVPYWNALVSDKMNAIDAEWSSIHEVLKWADKHGKDELLLDLVMLLVHYMDSRFLNLERVEYIIKAIRIAQAMGHKEEEALLRLDALAWTYIEEGRLEEAYDQIIKGRDIVKRHLTEIETANDLIALSFAWRARVRIEQDQYEDANRFIGHALSSKCNPWITSRVHMAAGDIALKQNRSRDALLHYEKTAKCIEIYGGEGHRYQIDPRIGFAHLAVGNLDEARKKFNALRAYEVIPIGKLYGEYGLAMIAHKENRRNEARQLADETRKSLSRRTSSNVLLKLTNKLFQDLEASFEIKTRGHMSTLNNVQIEGVEVVTLERPKPSDPTVSAFVSAQILPNRGMMVLQITAHLPGLGETDLLYAPSFDKVLESFGGEDDSMGNKSFAFGGAILLPFANRIRGKLSEDGKSIETAILGKTVRLDANSGGKETGAERYALHGLILKSPVNQVNRTSTIQQDKVISCLRAGDFGGHWLSATDIWFEIILRSESFILSVTAKNVCTETLPIGIGWHPYFAVPSRKREQARLFVPARKRVLVNNYDEVLPTGELVPVAGTPYDFSVRGGKSIGNLFLDDCFVELEKTAEGHTIAEIVDAEASYGLRVVATSPEVSAIQVYSLPSEPYIVLEPQFNWADPYGTQWSRKSDTGMVTLKPGEEVVYSTRLELFTP